MIDITFTNDEIQRASEFAMLKASYKSIEKKIDKHDLYHRSLKGILGELAVEKYLDIEFIDWSVGPSTRYDKPDIPQLGCGIKTHDITNTPLIWKKNTYPQIICSYYYDRGHHVIIEGVASVEVLNTYQNDDLVKNPDVRRKGKTAFTGQDHLENINILKGDQICQDIWIEQK